MAVRSRSAQDSRKDSAFSPLRLFTAFARRGPQPAEGQPQRRQQAADDPIVLFPFDEDTKGRRAPEARQQPLEIPVSVRVTTEPAGGQGRVRPTAPAGAQGRAKGRPAAVQVGGRRSLNALLAEFVCVLIALVLWLGNGALTVFGVMALLPTLGLSAAVAGLLLHAVLSRAELYLWHRWYDLRYVVMLAVCLLIDSSISLVGLMSQLDSHFPGLLLVELPRNPLAWRVLLAGDSAELLWRNQAYTLLAVTLLIALCSEWLLKTFWLNFRSSLAPR